MRHIQAYERLQVWPRVVQRSVLVHELGTSVCSSLSCVMVFSKLMYVIITVLFSFLFSCMLRICTFVHVNCAQ